MAFLMGPNKEIDTLWFRRRNLKLFNSTQYWNCGREGVEAAAVVVVSMEVRGNCSVPKRARRVPKSKQTGRIEQKACRKECIGSCNIL